MAKRLKNDTLTHKDLINLYENPALTADAVNLIYIKDTERGIERTVKGKQFTYFFNGKKVADKLIIARINKLAIPPAWENVWICYQENGHLQATGFDARKRKQYRYHALWNYLRFVESSASGKTNGT